MPTICADADAAKPSTAIAASARPNQAIIVDTLPVMPTP
jgi:hypothetical protein